MDKRIVCTDAEDVKYTLGAALFFFKSVKTAAETVDGNLNI